MEKGTAESVAREVRPHAEGSDAEENGVEEFDSDASKHGRDDPYDYQCLSENTIAEERVGGYRPHHDRGFLSRHPYPSNDYNISVQQLLFKHIEVRRDVSVFRP